MQKKYQKIDKDKQFKHYAKERIDKRIQCCGLFDIQSVLDFTPAHEP